MYYLEKQIDHKIIIDKSDFIAILTPIDSILDMPEILKSIKKTYPKATHYCTAYVFENSQGSNDDGEPSGTAGVPMLEVLNKNNLHNCFAVVVRYFGGIKLGAGGLIRAYDKSISQALIDAPILKR
nr:YigZ family protein [Acholeplasma laidlawii]